MAEDDRSGSENSGHPGSAESETEGAASYWRGVLSMPRIRPDPTTARPSPSPLGAAAFWRLAARESEPFVWRHARASRAAGFETWLVRNLAQLHRCGYPVDLVEGGRQWRTQEGRIADLVCQYRKGLRDRRKGRPDRHRNKAIPATVECIDQLRNYLDAVQTTLAVKGERVHGLCRRRRDRPIAAWPRR